MQYKLSKYNYTLKEDNVTIFNTFSGAVAILSSQEHEKMLDFKNYNTMDYDVQEWIKLGFIIEDSTDETLIINYNRIKNTFSNQGAAYKILTTSKCNANCFYCYENFSERKFMDKVTANNVSDFIIKNSKDKKSIQLGWFGGEPLMNPEVITIITKNIVEELRPNYVNINSNIITNGSLFSDEIINLSKTIWNIKNVQISLDGMKKTHELRKKYMNFENSFERTFDIIKKLLDKEINIGIRLNFDKENFNEILELIYFIKSEFGESKYLDVDVYPLYKPCRDENTGYYISTDDLDWYLTKIKDTLMENSFMKLNNPPSRRKMGCSAMMPNNCVIDANGDLYKCSMDMKDKTRSIGNVECGVSDLNVFIDWSMPILSKACDDCVALPMCHGGCPAASKLSLIDHNYCSVKKHTIKYYVSQITSFLSKEDKHETNQ